MIVLRSPLFVPGNRSDMLEKALGLAPDAYVPDMEDSVPQAEKEKARSTVVSFLPKLAAAGPLVIPRINPLESGLSEDDLVAAVGPYTYGVSVGKVNTAQEVGAVATILDRLEPGAGLEAGHTKLVLWLETAMAIVNAYELCAASPRVVGVAFGAEDFTNDMGIERSPEGSEIAHARSAVAIAARAAGVMALDTPYFAFRDPEGLRQDAAAARAIGFRGKFAIHPDQIDVINRAFAPTEAEVDNARRVVAAFEEAERSGRGATSLNGKLIDVPVVKRARNLLKVAETLAERGG